MTVIDAPPALDVTKAWLQTTLKHQRQLYCCAFSPDGRSVVAGAQDGTIVLWSLEEPEKKTLLEGHPTWVSHLAFTPDGKRLVSGDLHGGLIGWDMTVQAPRAAWTAPEAHPSQPGVPGWIRSVTISTDGKTAFSAGSDRVVRLWSTADGKSTGLFEGHPGDIFSTAVHPDGKSLVSGDIFGNVRHWDLATGKLKRSLDCGILHTRKENFLADVGGVRSLAFDREGTQLACGGMTDIKSNAFCPGTPAVLVFDWKTGQQKQLLRASKGKADDGPIQGLRFLEDGTLAGKGERLHAMCSLEFWTPEDGKVLKAIDLSSGYDLDLHPDGRRLCVPVWVANGRAGNGRHTERDKYLPHFGHIQIYRLDEKPADEKKAS